MRMYVTYARPTIECLKCGVKAEGELVSIGQWVHSMDEVHRILDSQSPAILVGWSTNGWLKGKRDLRCVSCTTGKKT